MKVHVCVCGEVYVRGVCVVYMCVCVRGVCVCEVYVDMCGV